MIITSAHFTIEVDYKHAYNDMDCKQVFTGMGIDEFAFAIQEAKVIEGKHCDAEICCYFKDGVGSEPESCWVYL